MPYLIEKIKIPRAFDGRVKTTPEIREKIKEAINSGLSQQKTARLFGVSRGLVVFISQPEKLERARKQYKERRQDGRYYDKNKHRESTKQTRRKKRRLFLEGKLA